MILKHPREVDVYHLRKNAGQRLDVVKNSQDHCSAGEGGGEKKREWSSSHPWDSPNLELRALLVD